MFGDNSNAFYRTKNILIFNIRASVIAFFFVYLHRDYCLSGLYLTIGNIYLFFCLLFVWVMICFTEKFMKDIHKDFGLE